MVITSDRLIKTIRHSFDPEWVLEDDPIVVGNPYREASLDRLPALIAGQEWPTVVPILLDPQYNDLPHDLTPAAFMYLLPAYMTLCLLHYEKTNLVHTIGFKLDPNTYSVDCPPPFMTKDGMLDIINGGQLEAICEFWSFMLAADGIISAESPYVAATAFWLQQLRGPTHSNSATYATRGYLDRQPIRSTASSTTSSPVPGEKALQLAMQAASINTITDCKHVNIIRVHKRLWHAIFSEPRLSSINSLSHTLVIVDDEEHTTVVRRSNDAKE